MQASLCLPTKNHQHFALIFLQSRTIPHSLHRLNPKASLFFRTSLYGGYSRRLTTPVMKAHMTPPEDSLNKARKEAAARSAATAAMVLACILGVMCTSFKARASWFGPRSPSHSQKQEGTPKFESIQEKSIKVLQLIFNGKLDAGTFNPLPVQKMLSEILEPDVLPKVFAELKKELDIEKADRDSTRMFLDKWKKKDNNSDKFNIGLVLIDLLIIQGDYRNAFEVCKIMDEENFRIKDVRHQIRMALVAVMLVEGTKPGEQKRIVKTLLKGVKLGPPETNHGPSLPPTTSKKF